MSSLKHLNDLPPPPPGKAGWPWTEENITPFPATMPCGEPWPRISIVTPSLNQGRFIEETIRSVLLQSYPNIEYMIIDGGSTDETLAIIEKYKDHLKYYNSEPDLGQADALNNGFHHATGSLYAYINSDDIYCKDSFFKVSSTYIRTERREEFFCAFPVLHFGCIDPYVGIPVNASDICEWINKPPPVHQVGVFWSSTLFSALGGFRVDYHYAFDTYFFLNAITRGYQLRSVSKCVVGAFRHHHESKTGQELLTVERNGFLAELETIWKRFFELLSPDCKRAIRDTETQKSLSLAYRKAFSETAKLKALTVFLGSVHLRSSMQTRFFWGAIRQLARKK